MAPGPQLLPSVSLAIGLLAVAWFLVVLGLLAGLGETTGEVSSASQWAFWSLAVGVFIASGIAPAQLSGRRFFLLVPVLVVAVLAIGWVIAILM